VKKRSMSQILAGTVHIIFPESTLCACTHSRQGLKPERMLERVLVTRAELMRVVHLFTKGAE
jgi:hypothetical protein